jgi:hypothetical protein
LSALTTAPVCVFSAEFSRTELSEAERAVRSGLGDQLVELSSADGGYDLIVVQIRLTPDAAAAIAGYRSMVGIFPQLVPAP